MTKSERSRPDITDRWIGTGLCTISAVGFASLTIFGKFALEADLSIASVLSLRFLGAGLILAFVLGVIMRQQIYFGSNLTGRLFLLGAVGYAGQSSLFFAGLSRNSASIASLLLYAYPVFVAIIERVVYQRRLSPPQLTALFLSFLGIVIIFGNFEAGGGLSTPGFDFLGALLILGSALWYAGYIVTSGRYVHTVGPWASTMWISLGASFSFALIGTLTGLWELPGSAESYVLILGMVLISTILAMGTFLAGIQRVGPTTASLLSTLEPVFTVLLAILLLNESLRLNQMVGGVFIVAAVILLTLAGPRRVENEG